MKTTQVFFLLILTHLGLQAQSPSDVLFTVGTTPVTVEEFTYIYEKNNGDNADYSEASVDEYLDLYTKFKLKVAKARAMQMDTIPELREELDTYRRQLANSYLMNKEVLDKLVKEAFERRKEDIQIAHILIAPPKGRGESGAAKALAEIVRIKEEIDSGKISFEDAALKYSTDKNSAKNSGVMPYLTAMLPQGFLDLENAMYTLDKGAISDPIKSKLGYHLIKVVEKRPARGVVDISHILIRKEVDKKPVPDAKEKAMEAYEQLQSGMSWADAVVQFSEDNDTKKKQGKLGPIGIGVYAPVFEDAAFAIDEDGAYTAPIETKSGFHIIKRNSKEDLNNFDAFRRKTEPRIERKPRYELAKEALIENIKSKNNYTVNQAALDHFTSTVKDDFYTFKWRSAEVEDEEIFRFNDDVYTLLQFVQYLKNNVKYRQRFSKSKPPSEAVTEMLKKFSDEEAILYEEKHLENSYPDFRNLMREYREGILLFEASKVNVWDKASSDSLGLKKFYEENRKQYMHAPKAKVLNYVVKSTDEKMLKKVIKHVEKNDAESTIKKFNKKDDFFVKTFEDEISKDKHQLKDLEWKVGKVSDIVINSAEKKATFSKIMEIMPARQKTLTEARGYVIADYQDYLEKEWVKALKREFEVEVNEKMLEKLTK